MASRASTFASVTLSAFHAPGLSERYHGIRVQVSQIQEQRHIDVFGFGLALGRDGGGEGKQLTHPRIRHAHSHKAGTCL